MESRTPTQEIIEQLKKQLAEHEKTQKERLMFVRKLYGISSIPLSMGAFLYASGIQFGLTAILVGLVVFLIAFSIKT